MWRRTAALRLPFFSQFDGNPRQLPSFPTRRSSDLTRNTWKKPFSSGENQPRAAWPPPCSFARAGPASMTSSPDPTIFSRRTRSEEHTSELQSRFDLVCRLLRDKKKWQRYYLRVATG